MSLPGPSSIELAPAFSHGIDVATVYRTDPIEDARWSELLERHPDASVFHTAAWQRALKLTYGYQALVFTTSAPGCPLQNGMVFSRVQSWLTGSRFVSVAFADHCQPLVSNEPALTTLVKDVQECCNRERSRYAEFRWIHLPIVSAQELDRFDSTKMFAHHRLDLRPKLEEIFRAFHKSCIQRKIRRAEREGLDYREGSSDEMLQDFYRLLILTRRRHGVPPQPMAWFRNLRDSFGTAFKVRIASKSGQPLASILTLQFKDRMVYKYGGSDARYHRIGTMPWLFWHAVQDAKESGAMELDLGRSDLTDRGLIEFKNHLGASSSILTNYRYPRSGSVRTSKKAWFMLKLYAHLPTPILKAAGTLFYRHAG